MNAKRGYVPEDELNFSVDAITKLRTASRHVCYLIDEGYALKQATTFVGNHFMLSERQRLAVMRSVATKEQIANRKNRQISVSELKGRSVWIDGFNTIITLEVLLTGSPVFMCMDGTIRDLAALRGTYRLIPETKRAVRLMYDNLQKQWKLRKQLPMKGRCHRPHYDHRVRGAVPMVYLIISWSGFDRR